MKTPAMLGEGPARASSQRSADRHPAGLGDEPPAMALPDELSASARIRRTSGSARLARPYARGLCRGRSARACFTGRAPPGCRCKVLRALLDWYGVPMSNPIARVTAVLMASLAVAPAAAEPLNMPADTSKAFEVFDEATEQLNRGRSFMAALEAGEKPPPPGRFDDWAAVVGGFDAAAEMIKKSPGPSVPDASAYSVPLERLRICATRPATLPLIDKLLKGLYLASLRCAETRVLLKARFDVAQKADETRRYLAKTAAKLAGSPGLSRVFTGSWRDLDVSLTRSISAYANEIKRYQDRVDRGSAEQRARAVALAGLAESYSKAKDCLFAGRWSGSRLRAGTVAGLSLRLAIAGTSWTGSANLDGDTVLVDSVTIAGSSASVSFQGGKASMKGTLSDDGKTYHGWFSSLDGPGTFSLQKQPGP